MKKAKLELVEQGDETTLYTISFEGKDVSEFGDFIDRFKDNAKLRRDYYDTPALKAHSFRGGMKTQTDASR